MGKFVINQTKTGFKFNLKATNGQIIATSEGYKALASCLNGIESVKKNAVVTAGKMITKDVEEGETI